MESFRLYCVKDFLGKFKRNPYLRLKEDYDPILLCNLLADLGDKLLGYYEIDGKEYLEISRKDLSRDHILNQANEISSVYLKQSPKINPNDYDFEGGDCWDVLSYEINSSPAHRFMYYDGECLYKTRQRISNNTFKDTVIKVVNITPDFFDQLGFLDLYCLCLYGFLDDIEESMKEQCIYPRIWDYLSCSLKSLYDEGKLKIQN